MLCDISQIFKISFSSQQIGDTYEEEVHGDSLPSCTKTDVFVSVSVTVKILKQLSIFSAIDTTGEYFCHCTRVTSFVCPVCFTFSGKQLVLIGKNSFHKKAISFHLGQIPGELILSFENRPLLNGKSKQFGQVCIPWGFSYFIVDCLNLLHGHKGGVFFLCCYLHFSYLLPFFFFSISLGDAPK